MPRGRGKGTDPRKSTSIALTSDERAAFDRVANEYGYAPTIVIREAALAGLRLVSDRYRKTRRNPEPEGGEE